MIGESVVISSICRRNDEGQKQKESMSNKERLEKEKKGIANSCISF